LRVIASVKVGGVEYSMRQDRPLDRQLLLELLKQLGDRLSDGLEVTLVGGSAGVLTAQQSRYRAGEFPDAGASEHLAVHVLAMR